MKKVYKKLNIMGGILLVMLVFLCAFNVTYAYFTARATVEGNLTFYDLNLTFGYRISGNNSTTSTGSTEFQIYPDNDNVLRGVPFGFKLQAGSAISGVYLCSSNTSCNAYVRIKVKAVKMKLSGNSYVADDDATDYGQYIKLTTPSTVVQNTADSSDHWYYATSALRTGSGNSTQMATAATISTDAPADVTNSYLKITLVFEAVQQNTEAVKDTWGASIVTLLGIT